MSTSLLLQIARDAITEVLEAQNSIDKADLLKTHPVLGESVASFVTLYLDNELRGSKGSVFPSGSLLEDIIFNARSAAFEDERFEPLKTSEYLRVVIELSLLTPPVEISYGSVEDIKKQVNVNEDGVLISMGEKHAAFLPQIWKELENFETFFPLLLKEADLSMLDLVLKPRIFTFQVESQHDDPIL